MVHNNLGQFITFDGIDGAGKTTQITLLKERLQQSGKKVYVTREPGGTELSEKIRELLLNTTHGMSAITELLLMFAARAEHIESIILPKIQLGEWVVCSRFTDATMAYQGYARGLDVSKIKQIAHVVHGNLNPTLSLFLDLPAEIAAQRREHRGEVIDRFEAEDLSFMKKVRNGYLQIAKEDPKRCKIIDARQSVESMSESIWESVNRITLR